MFLLSLVPLGSQHLRARSAAAQGWHTPPTVRYSERAEHSRGRTMSFIHPYLLFGLLLAGVPVLLHLVMRQKPKRLPFPAFRFLRQRYRVNQRKLNLQHLLLLLLRIAVVAALCFALARPRLFASRFFSSSDRPAVVVLLFDTSPSMDLTVGGVSRLDAAKTRARELLGELNAGSQVAVLDSGSDAPDVLLSIGEARGRIDALRIQPRAGALNRPVESALRLLDKEEAGEETPPRILYVFSDRTRACWDPAGLKPAVPDGVQVVFVDVGVDRPRDLGIEQVEVVPAVMPPKAGFQVRVRIRGTPGGHVNQVSCRVEGDNAPAETKAVQLTREFNGDLITFERNAPTPPEGGPLDVPYQVVVRLATRDALTVNNTRHATFLVRRGRKLLTLIDDEAAKKTIRLGDGGRTPEVVKLWKAVHDATRSFACEVRSLDDAGKLTPKELANYPIICLFQVAHVPEAWWRRLAAYVKGGGGLAIVPGGDEVRPIDRETFNTQGIKEKLLPAPLTKLAAAAPGKPVFWQRFSQDRAHPLMAPFVAWSRGDADFDRDELRPFVRRYWQTGKLEAQALAIARYDDRAGSPALLERRLDQGRVVLFTSPLDIRYVDQGKRQHWNNYIESSFGLVLIDRVCRYLGGEVAAPEMNFRCGQAPQVSIPAGAEGPFTLSGPGVAGAERTVRLPPRGGPVILERAVQPGNYLVLDAKNQPVAGFSLDVAAVETDLERVPVEQLEQVLGQGSVVQVAGAASLRDAVAGARRPPMELLPLLMMGLLVVLTVESLLANRFYRRPPEAEALPGEPGASATGAGERGTSAPGSPALTPQSTP
jgi:hypothetical protein